MESGKERQARWRARQRKGRAIWPVEVPDLALAEALIEAGMVDSESADPAEFHRAAASILADFAARFSVTRYAKRLKEQDRIGETDKD